MKDSEPIDLFGVPDDLKSVKKKNPGQRNAKTVSKTVVPTLPGQGFLPGLSRRGRPRLEKPISAVERTAEHRRKRIANGAKRVEVILDNDVAQALDRLAEQQREPRSEVIAALIRKAAARLKK